MRTCFRALILFAVVALCLPLLAADEDKKGDDKKPADKAEVKKDADKKDDAKKKDEEAKKDDDKKDVAKKDEKTEKKAKFTYGNSFTAKITQMDANSQRQFTVQVTNKVATPNPQAQQQAVQRAAQHANQKAQWQLRWAQIMQNNNLIQRQQELAQLQLQMAQGEMQYAQQQAQTQSQLFNYKDVNQEVQLKAADDVRVRVPYPPPEYDEKGRLKKYTNKELKALKGTENLPGYATEYETLRQGLIVQIYLPKNVASPVKKGTTGKGKKDPDPPAIKLKNDDVEIGGAPRLEAVMIYIISDPTLQQGK